MSSFNTKRFARYANFDLTINKSFYRNLALVLGFTIVGVIVISFFCRWFSYSLGMGPYMYNDLQTTAMFTTVVIWASIYIGAGCTLHPLRNKQGRITHMTMPATNLEKYIWHVLICVGGAAVVAFLSVLVADLLNYVLSVLVFESSEGVESLTATVYSGQLLNFNKMFASMHASMNGISSEQIYVDDTFTPLTRLTNALMYMSLASGFFTASLYALGNALKYKFNIPITYIILKVFEFCLAITFLIGMIYVTSNYTPDEVQIESFLDNAHIYAYVMLGVFVVAGIAVWTWAYHLYTKAQLTNKLNR